MTETETRSKWLQIDKSSHFAEKFYVVLLKGHIPPDCIKSVYTVPPYPVLFRLLREDEWRKLGNRVKLNGSIRAKNPNADNSVHKHVSVGSYSPNHSQYISTSASQQATEMFARNSKTKIKMVAKINCHML